MTEFNESMCCVCLQKYCDDFESIFANTSERTELSPLGHFYEELLQLKISTEVQLHYLCSHCNLQLKLFHKFKTKAVASYGLFSQFVATAKEGFTICELPDNTTQADCKIGVRASDIEEIHPLETETSLADISQVKIEQDVIETGDYEVQEFVDFTAVDDSRHAQFGNDGASPMLGLAKQKDEETKDYSCKDCDQVYDKKWLLRKHRSSDEIYTISTNKGGQSLCVNGYIYHFEKKLHDVYRWTCKKRRKLECPARISTKFEEEKHSVYIPIKKKHNHSPDIYEPIYGRKNAARNRDKSTHNDPSRIMQNKNGSLFSREYLPGGGEQSTNYSNK